MLKIDLRVYTLCKLLYWKNWYVKESNELGFFYINYFF